MAGPMHGPAGRTGARPKNTKKTLFRIFGYLKPYRARLTLVVACVLLSAGASITGTYFLKPLFNNYLVPFIGQQNPDLSAFIRALCLMGGIYAVGALSTFAYNRLMLTVSTGVLFRIRTELFTHLQSLPVRYFDAHTHGELMSRFTNDTDTLRMALGQSLVQIISSSVTVAGVFVAMLVLSPALTALVLVMLAAMLFSIKTLGGKSRIYFGRQQKAIGRTNGFIEEMVEGQKVVKVFCHEEATKADFDRINNQLFEEAREANTFASVLMPVMGNLSYLHYALTAIVGGLLSVTSGFDPGSLAAFLQFTRSFSMPITQMSQQFNVLLQALAGAERIFEVLDEQPEKDEGTASLVHIVRDEAGEPEESSGRQGEWAWKRPTPDGVQYVPLKGDVRFEQVTFGYVPEKTVLHGVGLYAKPGQKIAFVGSTGAGKTTITNLLNRFYDIDEGTITYDGIPLKEIRKSDLRRSLTMVLQDTHLFTGTVADNIRYGRLDASDEEVRAAARLAGADFFIRHLSEGYDTVLTADGGNLSQGQRQLLSIARAAVADPPVLVLDEATSSIDTRTEAIIERGMDRLMAGRTVFVIAHRLSTVRNANAIMVLEQGQIIERGDHDELIDKKGKYYQLYTGDFELS